MELAMQVRTGATGFALGLCGAAGVALNTLGVVRAWCCCHSNVAAGSIGDLVVVCVAACCLLWSLAYVLAFGVSLCCCKVCAYG